MPESKRTNLIVEFKQKLYINKLFKERTIDLNNYFKYSGRIEKGKRFKIISDA